MMTARFCPKCQKELKGYDHFFCSNCGETLPENVSNSYVPIKTLVSYYSFDDSKNSKPVKFLKTFVLSLTMKENRKFVSIALVLILIGIMSERMYGIIITSSGKDIVPKTAQVQTPTSTDLVSSSILMQKGAFLNNDFAKIDPSDISVYIELNDLSFLEFLGIDDFGVKDSSTGKAVLFKTNKDLDLGWGAVVELKQDGVVEVASTIGRFEEKGLNAGISEKYLLVSGSNEVYESMLRAKDSLILNFVRNSFYSQLKAKPIPEGKILILKISQEKNTALNEMLKYNYSKNNEDATRIFQLVEHALNSSYNEFVVN